MVYSFLEKTGKTELLEQLLQETHEKHVLNFLTNLLENLYSKGENGFKNPLAALKCLSSLLSLSVLVKFITWRFLTVWYDNFPIKKDILILFLLQATYVEPIFSVWFHISTRVNSG